MAEEWVTYKYKRLSIFIFSYIPISYMKIKFICSDILIWQILVQWILFGFEERLYIFWC